MKILLVSSSADLYRYESPLSSYGAYSIGLGYIYSVLKNNGHDAKMLVLTSYSVEESEQKVFEAFDSFKPDVVGLSILSINRNSSFKIIENFNKLESPPHIIIGGIHASIMYEQIIQKYQNVIAVIGEGEITIVELINSLEYNSNLENVKGIAFYSNNEVIKTPHRPLISDLDSLPYPNHDYAFESNPNRIVGSVLTSRGCPSRCSFCCLQLVSNHIVRKRSVKNVVGEIKYLKQKFPKITTILLLDDTFLLDNERVIEFCKLVIEENLNLEFGCEARVKPVSRRMFYWMKKAGFVGIMFGLETGSEKLLDSIHKGVKQKDVVNLMKTVKPFNFRVFFFMMCGFPGENNSTVRESVEFVQQLQNIQYVEINFVSKLYVFPGTEVYSIMKEAGHITDDYWMNERAIPWFTVEHATEELIKYENYIMDRVSLVNVLTLEGFCRQFLREPIPIMKYILLHKEVLIIILDTTLRKYMMHYYFIMYRRLTRRTRFKIANSS